MDVEREIGDSNYRGMRTVARLAAAYTLLELAPFFGDVEFGPADAAVYVYKTACDNGQAGRLWTIRGVK